MYCSKCGVELASENAFCEKCGFEIDKKDKHINLENKKSTIRLCRHCGIDRECSLYKGEIICSGCLVKAKRDVEYESQQKKNSENDSLKSFLKIIAGIIVFMLFIALMGQFFAFFGVGVGILILILLLR